MEAKFTDRDEKPTDDAGFNHQSKGTSTENRPPLSGKKLRKVQELEAALETAKIAEAKRQRPTTPLGSLYDGEELRVIDQMMDASSKPKPKIPFRRGLGQAVPKQQFDLTPAQDGAWGPEKAPMNLMMEFIKSVQSNELDDALMLSEQILKCEPENKLIAQFQPVLQAKMKLDDEDDEDDEDGEDGDEDDDDEEEGEDGDEDCDSDSDSDSDSDDEEEEDEGFGNHNHREVENDFLPTDDDSEPKPVRNEPNPVAFSSSDYKLGDSSYDYKSYA